MRIRLHWLAVIAAVAWPAAVKAQAESAFLQIGADSVQYLEFGDDGPALVLVHAADRGAETWADFAPRFAGAYRVVAMTARGVAPSSGSPQPVESRVTDLLALLDHLGIESAVFAGNSSPALDMVELATSHPARVSGLIFLAGAPPVEDVFGSDPTGAFAMAIAATQPPIRYPYRPRYLDHAGEVFDVPALTFVTPGGTRGIENQPLPLMVGEMVAQRGSDWIPDADSRAFFERLAEETELKAEVAGAWRDSVTPAILANERAFRDAFGPNLEVVEIQVPVVTGYEYMRAAELIVPHIQSFLDGLGR